jgi:hyperosmotically inducible protein
MMFSLLFFGFAGISMASNSKGGNPKETTKPLKSLADQVQHQLVMLPIYGVFDNLDFSIKDSGTVVLTGQVVRPMLKAYAETAVSRIQGVSKVENDIEVLPISILDDNIRERAYRAIYSQEIFRKYAVMSLAPIRIVVKNGNITLEGGVDNQLDKTIAEMAARSVFGAFSVKDELKIF